MHLEKHLPENLSHSPPWCLTSTNLYLDVALISDMELLVPIPATWLGVPEEGLEMCSFQSAQHPAYCTVY